MLSLVCVSLSFIVIVIVIVIIIVACCCLVGVVGMCLVCARVCFVL